jgi:murein DD-endopeptidase MepM/ murein hydrolase activator NlpD
VTESPLSGYTPDYDAYGYDAYSTGAYPTVGTTFAHDATGSYAYIPQQPAPHDQQQYQSYDQPQQTQPQQTYGYDTGSGYTGHGTGYDAGYDQTGAYATYDPYAYGEATAATTYGTATYYDTGSYDTTALWQQPQTPAQPQAQAQAPYPQADWDSGAYPTYGYGYGYGYDSGGDTGAYEQVKPAYGYQAAHEQPAPEPGPAPSPVSDHVPDYVPDYVLDPEAEFGRDRADRFAHDTGDGTGGDADGDAGATAMHTAEFTAARDTETERHDYAADCDGFAAGEPVARSRRRKPAKRSALLTVGVPSVAVMGVAAVGAAAVAGVGSAQEAPKSQADAQNAATAVPTTQLDRQLAGVSRDAGDFAVRASRTQERIDLKDRQDAAKKAAQQAAARKEALRPKFLLPVTQRGLSAYFGQAGVNWMALHTGIDFPVQVGTPVMAATDGTVRTQWNSSYGNMAIVTAPDGTETWYCHLSSTKIRSGKVQAGDVIAYSGNTGNTTGPHLHFEVRPNGGAPIDPLPWLLSHGLDPR